MNIWLDDVRDPEMYAPGCMLDRMRKMEVGIDPEPQREWVWVRTKRQLENLLNSTNEPIELMSFDHDLGMPENGYDIIKWLAERHIDRYPAEVRVHSANPVGAENIRTYDKNVRKHLLD